jgi:hypothetical protein
MKFSDSTSVSSNAAGASPKRRSRYAAVAIGAVTLFVGAVALAAGEDGSGTESNSKAVSSTAAPEGAGVSEAETAGARETKDAPAIKTQEADHHRGTDAKEHKASSKAHKANATGDVDSEIIVEGKQPQAQQHCAPTQSTGSRLRKTVCTTPAQQKANDKYSEQQAQDYLRRLSQQGTLAPENPSPFIQSGIP